MLGLVKADHSVGWEPSRVNGQIDEKAIQFQANWAIAVFEAGS